MENLEILNPADGYDTDEPLLRIEAHTPGWIALTLYDSDVGRARRSLDAAEARQLRDWLTGWIDAHAAAWHERIG